MAIVSSGSFVAVSNKIAGTTLTFTSSRNILSGDLAALFIASDNITTGNFTNFITSVTDNSINQNFQQGTGFNAIARTITSQSDGKILVGGDFTTYNGQDAPYIARLNTDGTLDTSFIPNYREVGESVYKLAIQSNITGSYYSGTGVWSSAGNLIFARGYTAGTGVQNEALAVGGQSSSFDIMSSAEEYNGSTWSIGGSLITARILLGSSGTQNAGLAFGGCSPTVGVYTCTEEYNGSTWSTGGSLIAGRSGIGGGGSQNSSFAAGGDAGGGSQISCTEEYDGTSWSTGNAMITARYFYGSAGTQNSGLVFGGGGFSPFNRSVCTEEYNGTSWSRGGNLIVTRTQLAGAGDQNQALAIGGNVIAGNTTCTEQYNGTSWSTGGALINIRNFSGGAGTQTAALAFGGANPPLIIETTEEYNITTTITCISDKIIAVGTMPNRAIRLNPDGTEDPSFNVGTGFNNTVCTVIVQDVTSSYLSNGVWTAAGNLINASALSAGLGIQNEALNAGGASGSISTAINFTEEYNGTSWAAGGNLINERYALAGIGTQNAGLVFGGRSGSFVRNFTEEYNGTSWTAGNNMIVSRHYLAGAGTQNEGLAFGGLVISSCACTEEYNGTSWAAGNALINARAYLGGAGTQNEALAIGGFGVNGCTEEYDGTTWTTGGTLINIDYNLAGTGTQNAAVAFGGSAPSTSCTEKYNGISWTTDTSMILPRGCLAGAGLRSAALAFGGTNPGQAPCFLTEEYTNLEYQYYNKLIFGGLFTSYNGITANGGTRLNGEGTLDTSFNIGAGFSPADVKCYQFYTGTGAWSVGGALITDRNTLAGAGTQNAGLAFGGFTTPIFYSCTEEYNGTSWTAGGALITARGCLAGAGTQNEALAFGGNTGGPTVACTEEYNGSVWTAGGALINPRYALAGAGTQNEGLAFGGVSPVGGGLNCTEEYNGTSWSSGGNLININFSLAGAGTQNAGLAFGGETLSFSSTEEYNGTSWTSSNNLNTGRYNLAGAGIQNGALAFGGRTVPGTVFFSCTEEYNGDSWSVKGAMIGARAYLAGAGTINEALAFGGVPGTPTTEEYSTNNLLVAGNFTSISGSTRNRLALLNANNGALIPTSSLNIGTAGFNANVNSLAIQPDNTIIAVGNFTAYSGSNIARIAKLNTDGTLDTTFSASIGAGLNAEANVVVNYSTGSFTVGVWATATGMITGRQLLGGAGTQNEALGFGGLNGSSCNLTEEYNGASWSAGGALITARQALGGTGTQNEALAVAGGSPQTDVSEEYNGSTWASGGSVITIRYNLAAVGTQNAGLAFGGAVAPLLTYQNATEEYNGTSWATGGNLITARCTPAGAGTQNEALAFGGECVGAIPTNLTEEYNGTSWATGGNLITARSYLVGVGDQNEALAFGGFSGSIIFSCTEEYNGISWATGGNLITARGGGAGSGIRSSALAINGNTSVVTNCVEEYIGNIPPSFLVGGTFTSFAGTSLNGGLRLYNTGNRDATFNIGAGFTSNVDVEDYLVEPDIDNGIIAVGGFTRYSGSFSPGANRIVKLTQVGTIDGTTTGNIWSKIREYSSNDAAGAGSTLALFYLTASYDIPQGTAITASISQSVTAKAATGWVFGADRPVIAFTGSISSSAAGGTSQPGSITLSNLTSGSGEYLFIRGVAFENVNTTTFTPTANFTTMSAAGTTGGANITNQSVRGEFRILTTASLASNPTLSTAASQASIFWTFYELVTIAGRTYFILLD